VRGSKTSFSPGGKCWFSMCNSSSSFKFSRPSRTLISFPPICLNIKTNSIKYLTASKANWIEIKKFELTACSILLNNSNSPNALFGCSASTNELDWAQTPSFRSFSSCYRTNKWLLDFYKSEKEPLNNQKIKKMNKEQKKRKELKSK